MWARAGFKNTSGYLYVTLVNNPLSLSLSLSPPPPPLSLSLSLSNLLQQLAYNKGILMHKIRNNNSPNYLAQLFISHQSHYINSRNNLYVPRPRLDLFETSTSFTGASLWNSLPQNIKSRISLPCFKRNLHKYMIENNLSSNLDGFV